MRPDLLILFTRPFWLDEWHAVFVANRATPAGVLSDLRKGADFGPPLLHLVLWGLRMVTGGGPVTPAPARALMLACVVLALWFVYRLLRRVVDGLSAAVGALAVASSSIIVAYAFETRFYAPWLLFSAAFAWALGIDAAATRSRRRDVAVAVSAVLLCTIHWFGILTLGLGVAGAAFALAPRWREATRRVAPAGAGVAALLACTPLLFGQRGAIHERSWMPDLSWEQVGILARVAWLAAPVLLAAAVIACAWLLPRARARVVDALHVSRRNAGVAALGALALLPVVLVVISLRQPAMLPRYALPALLAWAPLVALAAVALRRPARVAVVVLLAAIVLLRVGGQLGTQRVVLRSVARDRAVLLANCRARPVAFISRVDMYYLTDDIRRECGAGARYLVIPDSTLARLFFGPNASVQRLYRTENEFARLHARLYDFPALTTPAQLDSIGDFVVIAHGDALPRDGAGREYFSRAVFPHERVTPLAGNAARFVRTP